MILTNLEKKNPLTNKLFDKLFSKHVTNFHSGFGQSLVDAPRDLLHPLCVTLWVTPQPRLGRSYSHLTAMSSC